MTAPNRRRRIASLDRQTFIVRCSCCRKYCSIDRSAVRHVFRCGGCQALVQVGRSGRITRARQKPPAMFIGFSREEISYYLSNPQSTCRERGHDHHLSRRDPLFLTRLSIAASVLGVLSLVSTCVLICAKLMRMDG